MREVTPLHRSNVRLRVVCHQPLHLARAAPVSYSTCRRCALLGEFYFHDPRLDLIPTEHLASDGIDVDVATLLAARTGWSAAHVELLERGIELYWDRYEELASKAEYLSPPRLRSIGVIRDAARVRPYAQILNESTCTLYLDDLDPEASHAEFVAYLLAMGERAAQTGEILRAAIHLAPWWFDRTGEETSAFTAATQRATRPDASLYRAIAAAIPWLREIRHRRLKPPRRAGGHREIPGTGLLVPRAHQQRPDGLIGQIQTAASDALRAFHQHHRHNTESARPLLELEEWLAGNRPPLLVVDSRGTTLWDPDRSTEQDALRQRLGPCGPEVLGQIRGDLECVAGHSRNFLASLLDQEILGTPDPEAQQDGYAFLHHKRGLLAYNLDEAGIERLLGPGIPYARAMLGARTLHEWAHLAVDAGCVPRTATEAGWASLRTDFTQKLTQTIEALPKAVRRTVAPDLQRLSYGTTAAEGLVDILERRLPDFQANLLAARYQSPIEREAYVRQNIRPLRREYPASDVLRMLVRYLYEFQYLGFSEIEDPRAYFFGMTWFASDYFDTGILDEAAFDQLSGAARALCRSYAVDDSRFVTPPLIPPAPT